MTHQDFVKNILQLSLDMHSIIRMLIAIRNSGVNSAIRKEEEEKNNGELITKRLKLMRIYSSGSFTDGVEGPLTIQYIYDFIMNDLKSFEFDFKANGLKPFSLEQILNVDFYPDQENCPRTKASYRTIKSSPAKGNISTEAIERAVKVVLSSPDIKN